MALSKVDFNNINVTPAASKALKWNSSANGFETGDLGGNMVLLSTVTASSSANLDFTSSIDSTYKEYIFKYIDIHPASIQQLTVNFRDGGSDFDATKTTTAFNPYHNEDGTDGSVSYREAWDLGQSTSDQIIAQELGNGNDECASGYLHLFEPSSTTFTKHFLATSRGMGYDSDQYTVTGYTGGYVNSTTAVTQASFAFNSGNIDAGTITMYGVS